MVLLPEESVKRVEQHIAPFPQEFKSVQTPGSASKRLDAEMSDVLNSDIYENDREKWNSFQQVLSRFLALKNIDSAKKRAVEEEEKKKRKARMPTRNCKFLIFCKMCPKRITTRQTNSFSSSKKHPTLSGANQAKSL